MITKFASTCFSRNLKTLASLISGAGRFESELIADPEDRFSLTRLTLYLMPSSMS